MDSGSLGQGAGIPGVLGKKEGLGGRQEKAGPGEITQFIPGGAANFPGKFDATRKGISTAGVEMPLSASAGAFSRQ